MSIGFQRGLGRLEREVCDPLAKFMLMKAAEWLAMSKLFGSRQEGQSTSQGRSLCHRVPRVFYRYPKDGPRGNVVVFTRMRMAEPAAAEAWPESNPAPLPSVAAVAIRIEKTSRSVLSICPPRGRFRQSASPYNCSGFKKSRARPVCRHGSL